MRSNYNLTEAKANFDAIVDLAESGHPQIINRRNKEVVVVVSVEDFRKCFGHYPVMQPAAPGELVM